MAKNDLNSKFIIKSLESRSKDLHGFGVKKIGLFGSFSAGRQNKRSDLDFLVDFDKATFDNYMDLKFFLEKMFHKKVDLVTKNSLKPAMKYVEGKVKYVKGL